MQIHELAVTRDLKVPISTPRQSVTHAHWILETQTRPNDSVCRNFSTNIMQIVPGISLLKSQVAIISLSTLYYESIVKMKSPMDL